MNIRIETIEHNEQRYETCGDWMFDEKGDLLIRVSSMKNWKYELLIALHELVEVVLCKDRGITDDVVCAFDKAFEEKRALGNVDEPGDDSLAPYKKEHFFATNIERLMSEEISVDWKEYDTTVNSLIQTHGEQK